MTEADLAVGPAKAASEARAVDLILELWAHRRSLPEPADPLGESGDRDHTSEERAAPADDRLHAAIASDLERMQTRLDELLNPWRESAPRDPDAKAEASAGPTRGSAATSAGATDALAGGAVVREKAEADTSDAESTPSEHTGPFWSSSSLTELAETQGVGPVEDLEGIAALWPSDDDPDELLDHVLAERAARRRAMGSAADR